MECDPNKEKKNEKRIKTRSELHSHGMVDALHPIYESHDWPIGS